MPRNNKLSDRDYAILEWLDCHLGASNAELSQAFPEDSELYGTQKATSWVIVRLRQKGLIEDCTRCYECGQAFRKIKKVPLHLTNDGQKVLRQRTRDAA